jgi:hypothetical protein
MACYTVVVPCRMTVHRAQNISSDIEIVGNCMLLHYERFQLGNVKPRAQFMTSLLLS